MPTDYELWVTQHALANMQAVQVIEFVHSAWPGSRWITDFGEPFTAKTETGATFTAEPVAFQFDPPASGTSTQQEVTLRLDALGGYVMSQIRALSDAQREEAIRLVWRRYLDREPEAPAVDPLPFEILSIASQRLAVEIRAASTVLPMVAAGTRYTMDEFPTLAYL